MKLRGANYTSEYKARLIAYAMANPKQTLRGVIEYIAANSTERRPNFWTVRCWLRNAGWKRAEHQPFYTETHAEEARRLLVDERWTLRCVADLFEQNYGRRPDRKTLLSFMPAGFVYDPQYKPRVVKREWPAEIQAMAMELVIGEGLTPSGAAKRIFRKHGTAPGVDRIARWTEGYYTPKPKPEPMKPESMKAVPLPSHETPGDSWQRAWTAAEGLDGAAWADAVMREWLPDDRPQAAEEKRESRKRSRASAESRRLAA